MKIQTENMEMATDVSTKPLSGADTIDILLNYVFYDFLVALENGAPELSEPKLYFTT